MFEVYDDESNEDIEDIKEEIYEAKDEVEEAIYDILEMLNDRGIDLEGKEIAKITELEFVLIY